MDRNGSPPWREDDKDGHLSQLMIFNLSQRLACYIDPQFFLTLICYFLICLYATEI